MDENLSPQEGMNPELEVVEETEAQVETEPTVPKSQFDQVLARAKKAEAQLKAEPKPITNAPSLEDIQAQILISQGLDTEALEELKTLAKVRGKTLLEVQSSDPLWKARVELKEKEEKAKQATLSSSRGSGTVKKDKDLTTPGLSDKEFKELWMEQNK